jgi:hypothetical protein
MEIDSEAGDSNFESSSEETESDDEADDDGEFEQGNELPVEDVVSDGDDGK